MFPTPTAQSGHARLGAIAFGEPEGSTLAAQLEGKTLLAPPLIDYDLASIASKKAAHILSLRRRSKPRSTPPAASASSACPFRPWTFSASPATRSSPCNNAAYLWLARTRDAELVTLDRRAKALRT